jgi:hypothetical protein
MPSSILFTDSFDLYGNQNSTLAQPWTSVTTYTTNSHARNGAYSLALGVFAGATLVFASRATYIVGFALYLTGAGQTALIRFEDTSTNQVELDINSVGQFQFWRGGSVALGSLSSYMMSFNAWHYIEVKVTIDPSAGVCQLYVDGVQQISLSSQNTRVSSNSTANQLVWTGLAGASNSGYMDDLYVMDPTNGGAYTTFLGDTKVVGVLPNANGTTNNFTQVSASWAASTSYALGADIVDSNGNLQRCTTHGTSGSGSHPTWNATVGLTTNDGGAVWTCIQDSPLSNYNFVNSGTPNDTPAWLSDASIGDIDRYLYPAATGSSVWGVTVKIRAEKDDVGTRLIRAAVKSGATTTDNGTDFTLTQNSFQGFSATFETDPHTSAQWSLTNLNAAEFGVKVSG